LHLHSTCTRARDRRSNMCMCPAASRAILKFLAEEPLIGRERQIGGKHLTCRFSSEGNHRVQRVQVELELSSPARSVCFQIPTRAKPPSADCLLCLSFRACPFGAGLGVEYLDRRHMRYLEMVCSRLKKSYGACSCTQEHDATGSREVGRVAICRCQSNASSSCPYPKFQTGGSHKRRQDHQQKEV
jgi:hypothetical protein